jgi:putative SbcD/Mre11-related phosphoesterase
VWFEEEGALGVADLHLGYAWAQRRSGQLLPLRAAEDTVERLRVLLRAYRPREIILLGDIVHRALDVPWLRTELGRLITALDSTLLRCLAGNHDRRLESLLRELSPGLRLHARARLGPHLLLHGDDFKPAPQAQISEEPVAPSGPAGLIFMGHEHPAIRLSDGLTTSAKVPCFLVGPKTVILPAFSPWAAGSAVGRSHFLSRAARQSTFTHAIAILGEKLLKVPLAERSCSSSGARRCR